MDTNLALIQNLHAIKTLVLNGLNSDESKRSYGKALGDFFSWYEQRGRPGLSKAIIQEFRAELLARGLSSGTINLRLSAIRKLAAEAADNGLIDPVMAAGIAKTPSVKQSGQKLGTWLNKSQVLEVLAAPKGNRLIDFRNRAILSVMIGGGLRRSEVANLTFEHLKQIESRWVIADLVGKGNRTRTVPIPAWTKSAIDKWSAAAGITSGLVFRSITKGGKVNGHISDQAIADISYKYAGVAAHNLRRTFSKLAHKGGAPIEQIQLSLGHKSIKTTERYLGIEQNLTSAPCDFLGLTI